MWPVDITPEMTPEMKARVSLANEFFHNTCGLEGMKVLTWEDFSAWKEYVDGQISDPELKERATAELEDFYKRFGKYVIVEEEEPKSAKVDSIKRARAKLANKIYRKVCEDAGMELCFFSNFKTWSDFVGGVIGESEFYQQAKSEIAKMAARKGNGNGG
jgi:hypothetical protein